MLIRERFWNKEVKQRARPAAGEAEGMPGDHTEWGSKSLGLCKGSGSSAVLTHHALAGWAAACVIRRKSRTSATGQVDAISPEALPGWMPMTWLPLKVCICSQSLLTHFYW